MRMSDWSSDVCSSDLVQAGEAGAPEPAAQPFGTRVEVRDLFYATPARLKFLKSERAEYAAAVDCLQRLAMARPDVAFSLGDRSEERRVGKGCVSPCRSRWSP